jgi:serine/threonine protein kinase
MELYTSFTNAGAEVEERVISVQETWTRTRLQIEFHKRIRESLDEEHRDVLENVLQMLSSKLLRSIQQIQRVLKETPGPDGEAHTQIKRWKYPLVKDSIDEAIQNLETWQKKFDPSWYLMLRMATPSVDEALAEETGPRPIRNPITTAKSVRKTLGSQPSPKSSIFMGSDGLAEGQMTRIPHSSARLMFRPSKNNTHFIIDPVLPRYGSDADGLKRDIRGLARKLSAADPTTFSLLKCHGVVKPHLETDSSNAIVEEKPFRFVFSVPPHLTQPKSLRHLLLEADQTLSLSTRFGIAQQVAQSVSYIHTYEFVHKGVRPEKILVFQDDARQTLHSFLVGFDKFRPVSGTTIRSGDSEWDSNLYRHPQRQGLRPEEDYVMQHDMYSVGVCLLEIGLWQSFVTFSSAQSLLPQPAEEFPTLCSKYRQSEKERKDPDSPPYDLKESESPFLVKEALVELAKARLPSRMGDKYTGVVVNCLTCLDEDNRDFGDKSEFEDEDGIAIGVRYIKKVRVQMKCNILADHRRYYCN